MSTLAENQDGSLFVLGQIAQSVGDYFALIKRYNEAREEYQEAITTYNLIPHSSPDFASAQNQKGIVQKILDEWQNHTAPAINVIPRQVLAQLREWFANLFQGDWQPPEVILTPAFARSARSEDNAQLGDKIKRAKIINLSTQAVTMLVQLTPETGEKVGISLWIEPAGDAIHVPLGLQVTILDEAGATFMKAEAGEAEDSMELTWTREAGERYSVRLTLGNVKVTEDL